jgi:hypothetical protein
VCCSTRCSGDREKSYEDFITDLQKEGPSECRYGVFDFEYTHQCQGTTEVRKKFLLPFFDYILCHFSRR